MALAEEIARGARAQPVLARVPVPPPHNVPAAMSSFVGRADHVSRLRALLARDEVRLITLTGPGGTGKTRLALEVARSAVSDHPDGVFLASLAPLTDPETVPFAVASALGIKERGTEPIMQTSKVTLGDQAPHTDPGQFRTPAAGSFSGQRAPFGLSTPDGSRHEPGTASSLWRARLPCSSAFAPHREPGNRPRRVSGIRRGGPVR